jgi:hypothetical protein
MAEGDGYIFNNFKEQVMEAQFDLLNDTLKVALVTGTAPLIDDHRLWASISAWEESGTGYNAGGVTLAAVTVIQNNTSDRGEFDAGDSTWTGLNLGTPGYAVLYDDTHTGDLLVAYWELGTTATNGGNYTLQWNSSGIILLT